MSGGIANNFEFRHIKLHNYCKKQWIKPSLFRLCELKVLTFSTFKFEHIIISVGPLGCPRRLTSSVLRSSKIVHVV